MWEIERAVFCHRYLSSGLLGSYSCRLSKPPTPTQTVVMNNWSQMVLRKIRSRQWQISKKSHSLKSSYVPPQGFQGYINRHGGNCGFSNYEGDTVTNVVLQHLNMINIEWNRWRGKFHSFHIVIPSPSCVMTTFLFRFSCIYLFSQRQYLWAESGEELRGALLRPPLPGSPPLQGRRETGLSWPPEPIVIKPFHPKEGAWAGTDTVLSSCSINLPHLP